MPCCLLLRLLPDKLGLYMHTMHRMLLKSGAQATTGRVNLTLPLAVVPPLHCLQGLRWLTHQ